MESQPSRTILLVEDEPEFRSLLRIRLEANGYKVEEAPDGASGLETARRIKPDLLILDLMLPKLNGYQVARLLKFDEQYKHIPILMLTARSQQKDREMGSATGADAYLIKPFQPEELLATIASLVERNPGRTAT